MRLTEYSYTNRFLTRDGKPWFPIMGEMHYSRYPNRFWKDELEKMKAGGVDIVSSYVIWIHHEEIEGDYNFKGDNNLKKFVELCKDCGILFWLRIGPWSHAEVRNGGFPDWLLKKNFKPRTNDKNYFKEVKNFYTAIYNEIKELFYKDGGPIIGIQIENEYGHCGGLQGEEGELHMKLLTEMAKKIGFDTPYYTATGWGGACTGGLLPVMGGYCDAPWAQCYGELEPNVNYLMTYERNDHGIGSDKRPGESLTFDTADFPYLTAELGGGLQVTHHRRPVATAKDIGAMSMVKLASGCNLLGYYMYHGGTNPMGRLSTLQESRETDILNDLPILSYDFNAPIREYGQISDTFKELKLLTMFIHDFGSEICEMDAIITNQRDNPYSTETRRSTRIKENFYYNFESNYQRRRKMLNYGVGFSVCHTFMSHLGDKDVKTPENEQISFEYALKDGDYFFHPYNFPVKNGIITTIATPLCRLNDKYVFYTDFKPQYYFGGEAGMEQVVTLTRQEALDAWRVKFNDTDYLFISKNPVYETSQGIALLSTTAVEEEELCVKKGFMVIPKPNFGFKGYTRFDDYINGTGDEFALFEEETEINSPKTDYIQISETAWKIKLDCLLENDYDELYLIIDYDGCDAKMYDDKKLIADNYFTGQDWYIGLKRFNYPDELTLVIEPLEDNARVYFETRPKNKCTLNNIRFEIQLNLLIKVKT